MHRIVCILLIVPTACMTIEQNITSSILFYFRLDWLPSLVGWISCFMPLSLASQLLSYAHRFPGSLTVICVAMSTFYGETAVFVQIQISQKQSSQRAPSLFTPTHTLILRPDSIDKRLALSNSDLIRNTAVGVLACIFIGYQSNQRSRPIIYSITENKRFGRMEDLHPQHGLSGGPPFTQMIALEPAGPPVTAPSEGNSWPM